MNIDKEKIDSLIEQARSAFTNRKPESFHEAFSQDCDIYSAKENSLDCSNCDLVVPYSQEMLEDAVIIFRKQFN
ncbi:MAG: hypothetical protein BEU03_01005 [Marine Group III euryarchaeote CG-Epi6]|uniref:Uncharacterized protein n=1 Tax=Marine Group III euryarchaeote CG-Epi6 TaxID=1889000 RepID=A0A1J5SPW9_9ARCH|nr:MAG: hypothetical protein BEU03_01005 [Marine Group III euryarchaeote CG-Epi6]